MVGMSLSVVGITIALVQGGLLRVVMPKFGETKVILWGLWISIIGYAAYALATQSWMMYATLMFSSLGGVAPPAIHAMISRKTPSEEQGELQGSIMSMGSLSAIVAPLLYTSLFAHFTNANSTMEVPGAPYYMAAVFCLMAWIMILRIRRN